MTGKTKLYIGLLVLGLVLVGGGSWGLLKSPPKIEIPEDAPVIAMDISHTMGGTRSQLLVYEEGIIIYHEDIGLRPGQIRTRTWSTGMLTEAEFTNLLEFVKNSGFDALNSHYEFPGIPVPTENSPDAMQFGDLQCTISVNNKELQKAVSAFFYLSPDDGMTYPDMPYPMDEIYKRLRVIIDDKTQEVYQESIQ